MKLFNFLLLFVIALISLFFLQALWLNHTYQLRHESIEESINSIFYQTVEKELDQRFMELEKKALENFLDSNIRVSTFDINYSGFESNSVVNQQVDIIQQLMVTCNVFFRIETVDSIFHSLLQSNQYPFRYQINYVDSINSIVETAGQEITKGFKTTVLPVVNGGKIYVIVKITAPVVFKRMLAILIVSVMIFFFIIACLIYEIRIVISQHHINRLRENFTHALTHDMKTPLATIHSVLVQLEKENITINPDMRQKFNSIAIEQTLNLQATVNRILTLASIENKQLTLNKQIIDLPVMIQSLIDEFTIKSRKVIVFQTFYNLNNSSVYADPYYLNNVISNLFDNAIKYSGDSVNIEIECTAGEKHACICVRDNGFGISSNDQLKIFNRFERGAEIKRNRISGFGIGLNYVQQVIEAQGGTVTVVSQEGLGSEFVITLPMQLE